MDVQINEKQIAIIAVQQLIVLSFTIMVMVVVVLSMGDRCSWWPVPHRRPLRESGCVNKFKCCIYTLHPSSLEEPSSKYRSAESAGIVLERQSGSSKVKTPED